MNEKTTFGITPGFQEISLVPGEKYHGTVSVVNPSPDKNNKVSFEIFVAPFSVNGTEYTINFEEKNDYSQIVDWTSLGVTSGTLVSEEILEIPFTVDVPKDVAGDGQYMAFIMRLKENEPEKNGYQITSRHQAASILYASVDGEERLEGKVLENKVPGFVFDSQISASSLVENSGNVHTHITYNLDVYSLFSDEIVYSNKDNPKENIILPGTTLFSNSTWDETPELGFFRVVQTISGFSDTSVVEKTVFVCPTWFLTAWLILIFGGIFGIFMGSRLRKKSEKRAEKYINPTVSR